MSDEQIEIGRTQACWNVSGTRILKYTMEMYHKGLNEHKLISAPEIDVLNNKGQIQIRKWYEKWEIVESKRRLNDEKEANFENANLRTEEAVESLKQIEDILVHTLSINDEVDWDNLKRKEQYPEKIPAKPVKKRKKEYPPKPDKQSSEFAPVFNFFEKIFKSKREDKVLQFEIRYSAAISKWEEQKHAVDEFNDKVDKYFNYEMKKWKIDEAQWENRRNIFLQGLFI